MNKEYYYKMLKNGRGFIYKENDRLVCLITFYICNNIKKYIEVDPWKVLEDNPNGYICYIAQLITDKHIDNIKLAHKIKQEFKNYIQNNFKNVEIFKHIRFRNGIIKNYQEYSNAFRYI